MKSMQVCVVSSKKNPKHFIEDRSSKVKTDFVFIHYSYINTENNIFIPAPRLRFFINLEKCVVLVFMSSTLTSLPFCLWK